MNEFQIITRPLLSAVNILAPSNQGTIYVFMHQCSEMYAMAKMVNLAKNRRRAGKNLNSPWVWQIFKLGAKSGSLESGDYDENGEYDENSENQPAIGKITNLAKIRQRVRVGLILVNQAKIWLNSNSKRRCQINFSEPIQIADKMSGTILE